MASSYVFRKIDGELWQRARGKAIAEGLNFRDVVEKLLREWVKDAPKKGAKP